MRLFNRKDKEPDQFEDFPAIGALMVSKMITDQKRKPLFMYREKPANEQDSGWRIFSGSETQEYTDNPDNSGIYAPSTILKIDQSFADLLLSPVGSVYERENENSEWYEVNDFEFEDDFLTNQRLNDQWKLGIGNLFNRYQEANGDIVFTMKGKTVRLTIFDYNDKNRQEIYDYYKNLQETRDEQDASILETFELSDENVSRIGYMIEESDDQKIYKVIYAFSMVNGQAVLAALYFDNESDKDWVLETWKRITFEK